MDNGKRKRLGEAAWRELLARFAASGLSAAAFCRREAISAASFYQWRARLGVPRPPMPASHAHPATAADFIDLGTLRGRGDPLLAAFELRLELGAGLILQLRRG